MQTNSLSAEFHFLREFKHIGQLLNWTNVELLVLNEKMHVICERQAMTMKAVPKRKNGLLKFFGKFYKYFRTFYFSIYFYIYFNFRRIVHFEATAGRKLQIFYDWKNQSRRLNRAATSFLAKNSDCNKLWRLLVRRQQKSVHKFC